MSEPLHPLPTSYDEWLSLTPEQREETKFRWCPYVGEGRAFPMMAAARLMMSDTRIKSIVVGIYHGGEYILRPEVSNEDFKNYRPWGPPWEDIPVFEGFRVYWTKESYEYDPIDVARFAGVWSTESPECDAEFTIIAGESDVEIRGRCPSNNEKLAVKVLLFDGWRLQFESTDPISSRSTTHWFHSTEDGQVTDDMIIRITWRRVTTGAKS